MNDPTPKMDNDREPMIQVKKIHNLRDVGGLELGNDKRIREGLIYRSAQLGERNDATLGQLESLDLDLILDLRSEHEANLLSDFVPEGVDHLQLDVLADSTERIAAQLEDLFTDPLGASALLASGVVQEHYVGTYRNLVSLESARRSYSTLFASIASKQRVLFHCTAGKDRTGWAAAALQLLLGAPTDSVMDHYLQSNTETLELFGGILSAFTEAGGDPEALKPVFLVEPIYLESAIDEVESTFGGIEGYFREGLGLDDVALSSLTERLTET